MDENSTISVGDAYRAMIAFIDAYWQRGLRSDDQIASMISNMQLVSSMEFGEKLWSKTTADPAQWEDWLDAVKKVS